MRKEIEQLVKDQDNAWREMKCAEGVVEHSRIMWQIAADCLHWALVDEAKKEKP